jgi:hypothetical protein
MLCLFLFHYGSKLWVEEDLPLHLSVHNLAVTISETRLDPYIGFIDKIRFWGQNIQDEMFTNRFFGVDGVTVAVAVFLCCPASACALESLFAFCVYTKIYTNKKSLDMDIRTVGVVRQLIHNNFYIITLG